ncbi:MAG: acyl-CoA dehydrogenase family protein [Pseudomonadales bacterium]|nr:acyl-CoA dehydrogenase family protein [Pseudomonadales bacterium]MDP6469675.1 acyl-CoA dehydrogenase family protein [Pseudomonadales bacterium]MDP6828916.1 acyl-CoA dehydrogenase family protein [Pseudomonadales bacterium]MDP6972716.1 acyl-CoA dehydrogenase family protein [Pseudomonadales bacterium]
MAANFAADRLRPNAAMWEEQKRLDRAVLNELGFDLADEALQLHGGGYGYPVDYEVERIVRDLRVHQILEGISQIMGVIVSREVERTETPMSPHTPGMQRQ